MIELRKGENALLTRNLKQADGVTPLAVADLRSDCFVTLKQNGLTLATHTLGPGALRMAGDYAFELELTSAFTLSCGYGPIVEEYTLRKDNEDFDVAPDENIEIHIVTVQEVIIKP